MTSLVVRGGQVDVRVDDGRIVAIGPIETTQHDAVLDATGCSVLPGFVDLQVNGAVGVDLTTQPELAGRVAQFLPQTGVTSFMPTIISSPLEDIAVAVATMHRWASTVTGRDDPSGARSLGVHVEGPFLNPVRKGAHPERHLRTPTLAAIDGWSHDSGVAMVTIAPELPGAPDVIAALVERGVVVCIGHTDADADSIAAASRAGVRGVTHLFNAMGVMSARAPGPVGATLTDADLIAGLIVDGLHVHPTMVRLAWQALGPQRIVLVTDSMAALGLPPGTYAIGDSPVVVDETGARTSSGVLAGSVLCFDQAVRSLMSFTGCALADASLAASGTPARLAGATDIGRLAVGCLADIVLLDDALQVAATVIGGRVVWDPEQRWKS